MGMKIMGIEVEVSGQPPEIDKPLIYVLNHRSIVDPMIVANYFDAFVVAKAEILKYPILGKGGELTGVVYVNRSSRSSRFATRNKMIEILKSGENVMIYPEGTIGLQKHTIPFKKGAFDISETLQIPIVPVILEYRDNKDLWRISNMAKQFYNQFNARKTYTKLHFGPAFHPKDSDNLMQDVKRYIDDTLDSMHNDWTTMKFDPTPN